eukprot:9529755-Heterocapsa_arctica.AAC.1
MDCGLHFLLKNGCCHFGRKRLLHGARSADGRPGAGPGLDERRAALPPEEPAGRPGGHHRPGQNARQ